MSVKIDELWLGIDMGSTTVKCVVLAADTKEDLFSDYRRHDGAPLPTLTKLLRDVGEKWPDTHFRTAFTGSQSSEYALWIDAPYIQEVIAGSIAVAQEHPDTHTSIELGGQDAKILFFNPEEGSSVKDMRMNGVCAGGTGAFLDQIAALLDIPIESFNEYASRGTKLYDVSGRCGVFAKTDIQPLLNQGVPKEDIAYSCFHALAKQTIGGLAQGMEINKPVLFAGGPFFFMPKLIEVYRDRLELTEDEYAFPKNAQTFIALGTALALDTGLAQGKGKAQLLSSMADELEQRNADRVIESSGPTSNSFFDNVSEQHEFFARHPMPEFAPKKFSKGETVECYIGIDGGSTTTKFVVITPDGDVIYKFYQSNKGEPIDTARSGLLTFYQYAEDQGITVEVKGLGTTGYGEHLFARAFGADYHTVETISHKEAAAFYDPEVSFVLDLGGQDMKAIFVKDGVITDIVLNEACSAGCGSFIESYSRSVNIEPWDIASLAFDAQNPSVLGSRCTVFMNSSIISEQKSGKSVGDILGGLCASVIENLFTKVVRVSNMDDLGKHIVVQGGTFKNDAVLRAFEQYVGCEIVRPPHAAEMGALGIALLTRDHSEQWGQSHFIGLDGLKNLNYNVSDGDTCPFCSNACSRSIIQFSNGTHFVTGNRCERGEVIGDDATKVVQPKNKLPNMMRERETLLFHNYNKEYPAVKSKGKIGIPVALDFYDSLPFWGTFFAKLGYEVVYSGRSSTNLFETGLKYIPSDTVCLPAKVVHGHFDKLVSKGVDRIFYPTLIKAMKENRTADQSWYCAVIQGYSQVIKNSEFSTNKFNDVELISPSFRWTSERLRKNQVVDFASTLGESKKSALEAFAAADKELNTYRQKLLDRGSEIVEDLRKNNTMGILLSGRPYHGDSFINHGVADLFISKGVPVIINEGLALDDVDVSNNRIDVNNTFHARMVAAAHYVAEEPMLEFVQLVSFGCGHDAILTDELDRILRTRADKGILSLKLDEGENKGPLNIRITSFVETVRERWAEKTHDVKPDADVFERRFEKGDIDKDILIPNLNLSFSIIMAKAVELQGYKTLTMPLADRKAIEFGKNNVHNDICFPAQINIGEPLKWFHENPERAHTTAVLFVKNYHECRASQYMGLARKAFDENGFDDVPFASTDFKDIRGVHPGFKLNTATFSLFMGQGYVLTDAINDMVFKCRPYETVIGSTDTLHKKSLHRVINKLADSGWKAAQKELSLIIEEFNELPKDRSKRRPRVGIIGEILVNFHDSGNYNIIEYLEQNGMEVVMPAMVEFFRQEAVNYAEMADRGHSRVGKFKKIQGKAFGSLLHSLIDPVEQRMKKFDYYEKHSDIYEIAEKASTIMDMTLRAGEGWLIPGEILCWADHGVDNFIIVQPFGCLPNHITGRGLTKAIKEKHPKATIQALDFDPDTSMANIHNRMQMIILNATGKE